MRFTRAELKADEAKVNRVALQVGRQIAAPVTVQFEEDLRMYAFKAGETVQRVSVEFAHFANDFLLSQAVQEGLTNGR